MSRQRVALALLSQEKAYFFSPESRAMDGAVIVKRRPGFRNRSLAEAKLYVFDPAAMRLRPAVEEPSLVR